MSTSCRKSHDCMTHILTLNTQPAGNIRSTLLIPSKMMAGRNHSKSMNRSHHQLLFSSWSLMRFIQKLLQQFEFYFREMSKQIPTLDLVNSSSRSLICERKLSSASPKLAWNTFPQTSQRHGSRKIFTEDGLTVAYCSLNNLSWLLINYKG